MDALHGQQVPLGIGNADSHCYRSVFGSQFLQRIHQIVGDGMKGKVDGDVLNEVVLDIGKEVNPAYF